MTQLTDVINSAIAEVLELGVERRNVAGLIVQQRVREAGYRIQAYGKRDARTRDALVALANDDTD